MSISFQHFGIERYYGVENEILRDRTIVKRQNNYYRHKTHRRKARRHCLLFFLSFVKSRFRYYTTNKDVGKIIRSFGVKEILITFGSKGSLIYSGEKFYKIPAFRPVKSIDTTGCGDTYAAGYIAKRSESKNVEECGRFAAMCATMKIEQGVLRSKKEEVEKRVFLNS